MSFRLPNLKCLGIMSQISIFFRCFLLGLYFFIIFRARPEDISFSIAYGAVFLVYEHFSTIYHSIHLLVLTLFSCIVTHLCFTYINPISSTTPPTLPQVPPNLEIFHTNLLLVCCCCSCCCLLFFCCCPYSCSCPRSCCGFIVVI